MMQKNRRSIIILVLIVSALLAFYILWPSGPSLKHNAALPAIPLLPSPLPAVPSLGALTRESEAIVSPPAVNKLTDPFSLRIAVKTRAEAPPPPPPPEPGAERPKPQELKLEGIWVDSRMKVAFISGQALNIGDSIMGWTVVSISQERVTLQKRSLTKTLRLEAR